MARAWFNWFRFSRPVCVTLIGVVEFGILHEGPTSVYDFAGLVVGAVVGWATTVEPPTTLRQHLQYVSLVLEKAVWLLLYIRHDLIQLVLRIVPLDVPVNLVQCVSVNFSWHVIERQPSHGGIGEQCSRKNTAAGCSPFSQPRDPHRSAVS